MMLMVKIQTKLNLVKEIKRPKLRTLFIPQLPLYTWDALFVNAKYAGENIPPILPFQSDKWQMFQDLFLF